MPKFTVIDGAARAVAPKPDPGQDSATAEDALKVLKDYLNIGDPAVQQAVADFVALLARTPM